jgi:hypothetical protein
MYGLYLSVQGIAEVMRLLAQPEDLVKLPELLADYTSKAKANKATLSSLVQSQVGRWQRRGLCMFALMCQCTGHHC